jgi:hypothetical protein
MAREQSVDAIVTNPPYISATQFIEHALRPVLRAGLTDVLVTGMLIRWIITSARPIASGAKPAGALPWVEPMMMKRNIIVITTSAMKQATMLYWPGECAPYLESWPVDAVSDLRRHGGAIEVITYLSIPIHVLLSRAN